METADSISYHISKRNEKLIGRLVCDATRQFFRSKENRDAFEKWYSDTYGEKYIWKKETFEKQN